MKREEKQQQSRARILQAAAREFGERGYDGSSVNTICREGGISKGILYHYFPDKEALYLACVRECFDALTGYLREHTADGGMDGVQAYFDARHAFFGTFPLYHHLFRQAVLSPPPSLKAAIDEAKGDFHALNVRVLTGLLEGRPLRNGMTLEQAIQVILLFQDFVNARYQTTPAGEVDMAAHEELCRRSLDILLYGIVKQRGDPS